MTVTLTVTVFVGPLDEYDEEIGHPPPALREDLKAAVAEAARTALYRGEMNGFTHAMEERIWLKVNGVEATGLADD